MTARKADPLAGWVCTFPECIHHPKAAPVAVVDPTTYPVRISRAASSFLSGTGAWQAAQFGSTSSGERPEVVALMGRLMDAKTRKDGSATVRITAAEAADLVTYAEAWRAGASDNTREDGPGEYNAARALCAALYGVRDEASK